MSIDCSEVLKNLYLILDGEMAQDRCADLEAHINACNECLARYGLEKEFKDLIQKSCGREAVPQALMDRIRSTLRERG